MTTRILILIYAFCIAWTALLIPSEVYSSDLPNIVLILADDFGYECVGANGGSSYQTPHIDALAKSGMRFEQCYVQPSCTPTRLQLMTGMYNIRNYTSFGEMHLSQKTFANYCKEAGYATGIFGKWQLGIDKERPKHFGFDQYCLWWHTRRATRYCNPGLDFAGNAVDFSNGEYGPKIVHEQAVRFLEENKDKPFFLYYPMLLTHDPFQPTPDSPDWDPARRGEKYSETKHFKEMVTYLDGNVGEIVDKLEKLGLRENTLVLFLGDNGTSPQITSILDGKPYQGGKGTTTVAGTRVPLIASWPGKVKPKTVCDDLIDSTDFLPTICDALKIAPSKETTLDGISFYHRLFGQKETVREWVYCWFLGQRKEGKQTVCVHNKQYKLYENGDFYDIVGDRLEKSPIRRETLNEKQQEAAAALRKVLDHYKDARPAWAVNQAKTSPAQPIFD